jgi:hypothetical protein
MREEDDLGLRDWAVPPPPADLVERLLAPPAPASVPVDLPAPARRFTIGAVIAAGVLGAAAAAAAVAAVYESRDGAPAPAAGATREATSPAPEPPRDPIADRAIDRPAPEHTPPSEPRRFATPADRRQAWERLVAARALREAGVAGGAGASGGGAAPAAVSREDIQASIREVVPLLAECFELAGEVVQREGGTVTAELIVGSEPDVGTLVEDASLIKGDPHMLGDPDFTECLVETLMSVEMPPLDAGGQLVIHYPFAFSPDEPEATGAAAAAAAAEELAAEASEAASSGDYARALRIAEEALKLDATNTRALTAAAIAACRVRDARKAIAYMRKLSGARQGMVRQVCLRNNITLD